MAVLDREIALFNQLRPELEVHHPGRWVVIHDDEFVGHYDSFSSAADEAVRRFGRGPYLIRKIGAKDVVLPTLANWQHAG
jgi:hypothetical protein